MGTIRRLTPSNFDAMCEVIDSRGYFQGKTVDEEFTTILKEKYVRDRLPLEGWAYFLGYFNDDGELIAFRESRRLPVVGHFCMGVSYTKKGKANERYPGTQWPKALMELNHDMLDLIYDEGGLYIWVVGPATPPKAGRLVEAPGTRLADPTKYVREEDIFVKAGELTEDDIVNRYVLWGRRAPTDQVIMRFVSVENRFAPPPGAPPKQDKPVFLEHPPMNLTVKAECELSPPPKPVDL